MSIPPVQLRSIAGPPFEIRELCAKLRMSETGNLNRFIHVSANWRRSVPSSQVKRVRIRDVAAEAGVSATTTSFVLNGRDAAIPEVTRQRVLDTARRLGYRPNASARALATGRTHRIGVALNHPYSLTGRPTYHTEVIGGIMSALPHLDYNLLVHSANYQDWHTLHDDILGGAADGVLLVGREAPDPLTFALLEAGFPTVCVNYNVDHPD